MIFVIIFLGKLSAIVFTTGQNSIVTGVLYICSCLGALFLIILLMIFLIIFLGKLGAIVFTTGQNSIVTGVLYICSCLGALNQWILIFLLYILDCIFHTTFAKSFFFHRHLNRIRYRALRLASSRSEEA